MTPSGRYEEVDFDVEEALALVKEGGAEVPDDSGTTGASPSVPSPAPRGDGREDTGEHHTAMPWQRARAVAGRAPRRPGTPVSVALDAALGLVLAAELTALTDLPSFDTSAMD